jgi:hypothetical protein
MQDLKWLFTFESNAHKDVCAMVMSVRHRICSCIAYVVVEAVCALECHADVRGSAHRRGLCANSIVHVILLNSSTVAAPLPTGVPTARAVCCVCRNEFFVRAHTCASLHHSTVGARIVCACGCFSLKYGA